MIRGRLRRRTLAAVLAAVLVVALPVVGRVGSAEAAWGRTTVATGTFTAGTVSPARNMTCTAGLLTPITFNWQAPTGGLTRTGYRWTVTGGLTGSGTLAANATSVTLAGSLVAIGSGTFSLYAVGPGGWESVPVTGSVATLSLVLGLTTTCSVP
jgi:hypothetical protein